MWNKKKGLVFIISGPSGSGKSTLCHHLINNRENFYFTISCTTRPKRPGEKNAINYFFLSKKKFQQYKDQDKFLEDANVYGYDYATLKKEVFDKRNQGYNIVIDIDVQGALNIKENLKNHPEVQLFFCYILIAPPNIETLETRVRLRNIDTEKIIKNRLSFANNELLQWEKYDYLIINNDLEQSKKNLDTIVEAKFFDSKLFLKN